MTVTIVNHKARKSDPLKGVPGREVIDTNIAVLRDEAASFNDKNWAAGQLRGQWLVLRKIPQRQKAADYINEVLTGYRNPREGS